MKLHIPLTDGTTLTFEGEYEELVQTAEKFLEKHGSLIAAQPSAATQVIPPGNGNKPQGRRWNEQSVKRLWGMLYGEQAKVVKFLVGRGGKTSYSELTKHLGYGAQHLSGILSPITRNAQTATGDRLARLVDWRVSDNGVREYYVDPDALPLLQPLLGQP